MLGVSLCLHMHMSVVNVHVRCLSECARVSSVHVSVCVCAHVGSQCTCQVSVCVSVCMSVVSVHVSCVSLCVCVCTSVVSVHMPGVNLGVCVCRLRRPWRQYSSGWSALRKTGGEPSR